MILPAKHTILFAFGLAIIMAAFACESNFKEVQKSNFSEFVPSGEAEKINLKYTDSGRITAILISPLMKDFAAASFPFTEFPNGIDLTLFDKSNKRTVIVANHATSYKLTSIIDLKGKVKISSQDGQILETEQLFYDQKNEWFFTENKFKFTDPKAISFGEGIDFSKDFKVINSQRVKGEIESDE